MNILATIPIAIIAVTMCLISIAFVVIEKQQYNAIYFSNKSPNRTKSLRQSRIRFYVYLLGTVFVVILTVYCIRQCVHYFW